MLKKMTLLWMFFLLLSFGLMAQSKYYEKNIAWEYVQAGHFIFSKNDANYIVGGNYYSLDNLVFKPYAMELNQYGDTLWLKTYEQDTSYAGITSLGMIPTSYGYALTGNVIQLSRFSSSDGLKPVAA